MEIKSGIYCIENKINGKQYIGSSKNVYKRKNRHFSELKNNKHKNPKLQNSYIKHGKEVFTFYVLEFVESETELVTKEQYYIDKLKQQSGEDPPIDIIAEFFKKKLVYDQKLLIKEEYNTPTVAKADTYGAKK